MQIPDDFLDKISTQVSELLDHGKQTKKDVSNNVRALVHSQLAKLDVVGREEFESQQRVLEKTQTHIAELEAQLKTLEEKLHQK